MPQVPRRTVLTATGIAAGQVALGLPTAEGEESDSQAKQKLKVVVTGGHPDDPETGCGGTIARYSQQDHEVVVLYLTRGEAGVKGKTHEEAAAIRTEECQRACLILGAHPKFAGQIDSNTEVNLQRYEEFSELLAEESPDLVFTHWPICEQDHRETYMLTYQAWKYPKSKPFELYFYEVASGQQTMHFWPTHYVDITSTEHRKRAAVYEHKSQNPEFLYSLHGPMNEFRGMECGCKHAEAFVRLNRNRRPSLPMLGVS